MFPPALADVISHVLRTTLMFRFLSVVFLMFSYNMLSAYDIIPKRYIPTRTSDSYKFVSVVRDIQCHVQHIYALAPTGKTIFNGLCPDR